MPGTNWAALITAFATMALLSCACTDRETQSRPEKALATIASPGEAAERATPAAPRGPALVFVAFDSDGSKVVVWNLETWQPIRTFEFRVTDEPTAVALAGDMILYAFLDRVEVEPLEGGSRTPLWHAGADQAVTTIAVSPDGELVAIGVEGRDISDLSRARLVIVRLSDGAVIREFGRDCSRGRWRSPGAEDLDARRELRRLLRLRASGGPSDVRGGEDRRRAPAAPRDAARVLPRRRRRGRRRAAPPPLRGSRHCRAHHPSARARLMAGSVIDRSSRRSVLPSGGRPLGGDGTRSSPSLGPRTRGVHDVPAAAGVPVLGRPRAAADR